jgi:hypothetical protein
VNNIKQIQTIPNISRIVGAVTVQVSNILELDKICEYFLNDLGIVFHTHRVEYPKILSAQVLPRDLITLAIYKLEECKLRVPTFKLVKEYPQLLEYTLGQLQDNINYLQARDQSDKWNDCIEFNHRLDRSRNTWKFEAVTPDFKPYV